MVTFAPSMPDGVIGNTSDSGSEESRFEPWSGNKKKPCNTCITGLFFDLMFFCKKTICKQNFKNCTDYYLLIFC